jgi:hypothetical protein
MNSQIKHHQEKRVQGVPSHISIPHHGSGDGGGGGENASYAETCSFASDAIGHGVVAEELGAALDEVANAIDEMLREASDDFNDDVVREASDETDGEIKDSLREASDEIQNAFGLKNKKNHSTLSPGYMLTDSDDTDSDTTQYDSDSNEDDSLLEVQNRVLDTVVNPTKRSMDIIPEIKQQKNIPFQKVISDKNIEETPPPEVGPTNEWACPKCTLLNSDVAPICALCRQINPAVIESTTTTAYGPTTPPPPQTTEPQQQQQQSPDSTDLPPTKRQFRGAVAAGGIAGLVLAGPVLGVILATGAAVAVTSGKKGTKAVREMARKSGDAMADAGVQLKREARNLGL